MKKAVFIICLLAAVSAAGFAQNGIIRDLTGEVELKPAGAQAFTAAAAGAEVAPNTIISTGFRSTAIIAVGSSLITVRPLTRLSLSEIQTSANTENVNVSLQTGRVRVDVKPPAGTKTSFSVQGPSATASVRGTSFEFDTINLNVQEGKVIFGGTAGPITVVSAGNESFIQYDGTAADPVDVAASSLLPPPPVGAPEITVSAGVPPAGGASASEPDTAEITVELGYK